MEIGLGYWSLPAIDRRIADLEKNRPRRWQKRLNALKKARKEVVTKADQTRMVKGWKGKKKRAERYFRMRDMLNTGTLESVGKHFGISRQRVHQIVSQWK